jgi:L-arabinose isomerase
VDAVICYVGTYATSSQVLPVVQRADVPAVFLNLQPTRSLEYATASTRDWLGECSACCLPEIANAFRRARIPFRSISGLLRIQDGMAGVRAWEEIDEWVRAVAVYRALSEARLGFLGHTYPGMLDMYTDLTQIHAQFGAHVELLELDDLSDLVTNVPQPDVKEMQDRLLRVFDLADPGQDPIAGPAEDADLAWAARVATGLEALVNRERLDALTYYYRGLDNEFERVTAGMIPGLSLLTAAGVPCAGEGDIKNAIAMFMLDRLNAGGSFTELYAMDFVDDIVLVGHDGPAHLDICDGRPVLRKLKLFHGKAGYGMSIECRVRPGPVTLLGLAEGSESFELVVAEGQAEPGPTLAIGNTNTRVRFGADPARFVDEWCAAGPTHHCALGTGHQGRALRKVADLLGMPIRVVAAGS